MKMGKIKLFGVVCFFLFATASFAVTNNASAQDAAPQEGDWATVAPLVNSQTPFVVRLDLASLDLDKTSDSLKRVFNEFLKSAEFDEESNERCQAAFDKTVDSWRGILKRSLTNFLDGASLPQIYVVGVWFDDSLQFVGVVPAKDKSEAEQEELRELASKLKLQLYKHNSSFLFSPQLNDKELFELLGGLQAEPNPAMEKFFNARSTTIDAYIAKFPFENALIKDGVDVEKALAAAKEQNFPIYELWNTCKDTFESAELSFNLNELTSSAVVTFKGEEAASTVRKELESLIDAIIVEPNKSKAKKGKYGLFWFAPATDKFGLSRLSLELTRATARKAFLPRVEGARLVGDSTDSQGAYFALTGSMIAWILPNVATANKESKRTQCAGNLKHIVLAIHNFHDAYNALPPAGTVDVDGKPMHSWRVYLLPCLGQRELYNKIRLNEPWDSEWNSQFHSQIPDVYRCPVDKDAPEGTTRYAFVVGEQTPFEKPSVVDEKGEISREDRRSLASITDGLSNTICVVERKKAVCWMDPTDEFNIDSLENGFDQSKDDCLSSSHKGDGANVGLFDGSVHFLSNSITPELLKAYGTRNGGESVMPIK